MTYQFDEKVYKKSLNKYCRTSVKKLEGLAKFLFYLDLFLRIFGIGFFIGLIAYMIYSKESTIFNWILLVSVPVVACLFSYLIRKLWTLQLKYPYDERYKRKLYLSKNSLHLSYCEDGCACQIRYTYRMPFKDVTAVTYNKKAKLLIVSGDIEHYWIVLDNGTKKKCNEISFFNCYNEDIYELLKKRCSKNCIFDVL